MRASSSTRRMERQLWAAPSPPARPSTRTISSINLLMALPYRQSNRKGGPDTRLALYGDLTIVPFDNAVRDGEAEAGPLSHGLCREKWLENLCQFVRLDTLAGVRDAHDHGLLVGFRLDGDHAALGRRLYRIQEQVHEHLIDLSRMAMDQRQFAQLGADLESILWLVPDEAQCRLYPVVDIRCLEVGLVDAREIAQPLHDLHDLLYARAGLREQYVDVFPHEIDLSLVSEAPHFRKEVLRIGGRSG